MDFLSTKYDELLKMIQTTNEKSAALANDVKKTKQNLESAQKSTNDSKKDIDNITQYLWRDCLEITGVLPKDISCTDIVQAIAKDMDIELEDEDIWTFYPLPTYSRNPNKEADPKLIVKCTR